MKHILVTGGAGFIGSHLTTALLASGHHVTVIDDESTGAAGNLADLRDAANFSYLRGSCGDAHLLRSALEGVDEVYHLAAAVGVALIARQPLESIERNIGPVQLLLSELRRSLAAGRPIKLFLASTSEVYGKNPKPIFAEDDDLVFGATTRPRWSYGAAKAIDEFLALAMASEYQLPVVIGRFFNVVGPRQSGAYGMVLPRFVQAALAGKPLVVHDDGQQVRCFAHVSDVIGAVLQLMETPAALGRVFNIGSDEPVTILELAQRVIRQTHSVSPVAFQTYADAYNSDFEDIRRRVPDLSRLRATIDYQPRFNLDGIIQSVTGYFA
ncbi:MAG TPA: NAD-dependent epimerase/dehydratase family protein [Pirellulaceae bacterium]|nr:NAD-dependent epimerase/dehydratase family protein [Pirellulaceae bacterium]